MGEALIKHSHQTPDLVRDRGNESVRPLGQQNLNSGLRNRFYRHFRPRLGASFLAEVRFHARRDNANSKPEESFIQFREHRLSGIFARIFRLRRCRFLLKCLPTLTQSMGMKRSFNMDVFVTGELVSSFPRLSGSGSTLLEL
jgi:hypothetical protein